MASVVGGYNPFNQERGRVTRVTALANSASGIITVTTSIARIKRATAQYNPSGSGAVASGTILATVVSANGATVDVQFASVASGGGSTGLVGGGLSPVTTSGYTYSGGVLEVFAWGD